MPTPRALSSTVTRWKKNGSLAFGSKSRFYCTASSGQQTKLYNTYNTNNAHNNLERTGQCWEHRIKEIPYGKRKLQLETKATLKKKLWKMENFIKEKKMLFLPSTSSIKFPPLLSTGHFSTTTFQSKHSFTEAVE
ncbi:conserved hypothetical protein [Trichinella spiralis]|uniref:hypothetical protein n=1 Tax=Trichinella spiralis TaxID=6334 RepID=UPI0001EFE3D5|nr:conserved hypothetical protein [Trichinella spiralis]